MTVTINPDDVTKVTFQFFRLREKVTEGKTKVLPREHHGAMIVKGDLAEGQETGIAEWRETEIIVVPIEEIMLVGKFWQDWRGILAKRYREAGKININEVFDGCFDIEIPAGEHTMKKMDCGPFDARESRGNGTLRISDLAVGCYAVELRRKDGRRLECGPAGCRRVVKVEARTPVKLRKCGPSGCKVGEVVTGEVAAATFSRRLERALPPPDECVNDPSVKAWLDGPQAQS